MISFFMRAPPCDAVANPSPAGYTSPRHGARFETTVGRPSLALVRPPCRGSEAVLHQMPADEAQSAEQKSEHRQRLDAEARATAFRRLAIAEHVDHSPGNPDRADAGGNI